MKYVLASVCMCLLAGCAVTNTHEAAKPAKATYELWIDGKKVQQKTVTWEYPDPMEEPKDE